MLLICTSVVVKFYHVLPRTSAIISRKSRNEAGESWPRAVGRKSKVQDVERGPK
jgi:hypothetical protein